MSYWNPKDQSSYDKFLRDGGRSGDLLRMTNGVNLHIPSSAWSGHAPATTTQTTGSISPPGVPWLRRALAGAAFLIVLGAVAVAVADDATSSPEPDDSLDERTL